MTDQSPANQQRTRWISLAGIVGVIALVVFLPPVFADVVMLGAMILAAITVVRALLQQDQQWRRAIQYIPYKRLFVILAFLLMGMAAVFFTPVDTVRPLTERVGYGALATITGAVMLIFALNGTRLVDTVMTPLTASTTTGVRLFASVWHKLAMFCGALMLLFVAEASANLFHVSWLRYTPSHHQFMLLVGGIVLVTWGLGAWHTRRAHPLRVMRWEVLALVFIGVGAFFVRVWQIDTRLLTLVDELNFISHVMHFWEFNNNPLAHPMTGVVPFTRVFAYWETWSVAVFGRDLGGIRMASVFIGTANVIALWWLARHLFDRTIAIIAAVMLATFPMHIHFSRLALNNIVDPLVGTLALAFLVRGLQSRSRWDFALAGAFFGMVPYFYEAGRLIFPALTIAWLVWIVWYGRRRLDSDTRWSLLAMGLIAGVIAMPVYYNTVFVTRNVGGRLTFVSLGPDYWLDVLSGNAEISGYINNLARGFLLYINRWETFIHYGGVQPLVLTVFVPVFLMGVVYALYGTLRRSPGGALLVLWFALVGFGNSFLADPAATTRHVITMPVVALFLALGVVIPVRLLVWNQTQQVASALSTRLALLLIVSVTAVIGVRQVDYYYNDHLPILETQIRLLNPYRDVTDALIRAADLPAETHVTLIPDYTYSGRDSHDFLRYLADGMTITTLQAGHIPNDYFDLLELNRPQAFLLVPGNEDVLDELRLIYGEDLPEPQLTTNLTVPEGERFVLYTFPPGAYRNPNPPEQASNVAYEESLVRFYGMVLLLGVTGAGAWFGWRHRPSFNVRLPKIDIGTFPDDPRLSRWALGLSGILLALAIFALSPVRLGSAGMGALFAAGSGAAFGVSLLARPLRVDDADHIATTTPRFVVHTNRVILGVALLVPLVVVNASQLENIGLHIWAQAILFVGGVLLIGNAFGQGYGFDYRRLRDYRAELLALVAIIVLAAVLRVVDLEYAVHRFIDEMHSVEAVNNLHDDPYTALFSQHGTVTSFTWLYALLQTATVEVYGPSLTGLRVVSVIFGVLTVPALWWLARLHFDRRTALFAALILATFPPHVHFSRIGLNNIVDPLLGVLALAFITRGMQTGNDRDFALGGMTLGLTQYFYEGGRLLYPPLIVVFVVLWLLHGARRWRGLAVLAVVFVVVAAPVYLTWESYDYDNTPRLATKIDEDNFYATWQEDGLSAGMERLAETVYRPAWLLVQHPDEGWFYGGDTPLIHPALVPLFLVGVFFALFRMKKTGLALLVVWVGAALVGNALLVDRMDAPRYVVIFPAVVLLLAVGLRYTLAYFNVRRAGVVTLVAGLVIAVGQTVYYFNSHLPRFNDQYLSATIFDDVLFRVPTLPPNTQVYIITGQAGLAFQDIEQILRFHDREDDLDVMPYERGEFLDEFIADIPENRRLAFFYQSRDRSTRTELEERYPTGTIHRSPYDSLPPDQQFHVLYVVD